MVDECPPFNAFFIPTLEISKDGEINLRVGAETIAENLKLSDHAKSEVTRSGAQRRYIDRTIWAATYLVQAGLLNRSRRGFIIITQEGKDFLANNQSRIITREDLLKFPKFAEFMQRKGTRKSAEVVLNDDDKDDLTPSERMDRALGEIHNVLANDILDKLLNEPPAFFEATVVDLFQTMGYGTGRVVGQSGDNGIDGVIDQDKLGLERVYIQAKRYQLDTKINSADIRNFAGSLSLHQANKGLFVTTTQFSSSAKETADKLPNRIVLIDGYQLANLMIEYNIGCTSKREYAVKQLDQDYFSD